MTDVKKTKKALIASVAALMLCVVMLLGTTYAWFTDTASTAVNNIQAGELKIALEYQDAKGNWQNADGQTLNFKDLDSNIYWEPGCTYELPAIRVRNNGNLALKYDIVINGVTGDAKLLEAIDFNANGVAITNFSGHLDTKDAVSESIVIKGHMKEEAGNEYQGLTLEGIGITVYATQYTYEYDSFGNQYDANARPTEVSNVTELADAIENGKNVVLTNNIELTSTLMAKKDVVIDLNGNTITAPSSGVMFQSQSNAAPSMIITSSTAGAAINAGSNTVLLGYGSTEISNVTINVENATSSSSVPFNVYGDLTLGKGTVVNVDNLGTSLISNNGAVDIVIDGAEINIGTFKVNGSSVISLNKASTLEMKDTNVKIGNFVLSSFGGDSLVSKVDGVTIDGCTFDVTDSNGASCTFEAKDGKYRLVQE